MPLIIASPWAQAFPRSVGLPPAGVVPGLHLSGSPASIAGQKSTSF